MQQQQQPETLLAAIYRTLLSHWSEILFLLLFAITCTTTWCLGGRIASDEDNVNLSNTHRKAVSVLREVLFLIQPIVYAHLPLRLMHAPHRRNVGGAIEPNLQQA